MSSRSETPSQTTGAHRRHRAPVQRTRNDAPVRSAATEGGVRRRTHGTLPAQPPAHYEPYLDGLFTYCLSVLCEHDAAAGALGDVLAMAERQRARLHDPELRRPWLYALARWACLRRLSQDGRPVPAKAAADVAAQRRRELSALAWPEAAGTTPEQREALELAVRHQLAPNEVAHVVGIEPDAARALLAQAACEVERTRAALAVVELGRCPAVARLAGDTQVLLGPALRRELVRHVDECPDCRFTAERAVATAPWPGLAATTAATAVLAVIEAPRPAAYAALLDSMRAGAGRTRESTPRFDRRGFPLAVRDRAARRARLRNRAVTSTVIAAVVAAPVLALWAAYHGASLAPDEKTDEGSFSAPEGGGLDGLDGHLYEKAGVADSARPGPMPRVRVSVASGGQSASPAASLSAAPSRSASSGTDRSVPGPGRLTVAAEPRGDVTVITLTASGGSDVRWSASTGASWLRLSRDSGVLRPGDSTTITVAVDHASEPPGPWTARIAFAPSGSLVTLQGTGRPADSPSAEPTPSGADPSPTGSASSDPSDGGGPPG
ncbi:sigma-70 family RNA polymerase sigma factor [Streptomyces sp. NBC_01262]